MIMYDEDEEADKKSLIFYHAFIMRLTIIHLKAKVPYLCGLSVQAMIEWEMDPWSSGTEVTSGISSRRDESSVDA